MKTAECDAIMVSLRACLLSHFLAIAVAGLVGCQGSLSGPPVVDAKADAAVVDGVAEVTDPMDIVVSMDAMDTNHADAAELIDVSDAIFVADVVDVDDDGETPMDIATEPADVGEPGFLKWVIPTGPRERFVGVAIDFDGNLIVPREQVDPEDSRIALKETLVKISPSGAILAESDLLSVRGYSWAQIRPDGTVLVPLVPKSENGGPCSGAKVFAYGPDFEEQWIYSHPFALRGLLAIRSDNVTLGHFGNTVLALSPKGEPLWQVQLEQSPYCDGDPDEPWLVTSPLDTPIVIDHDDVAYAFEYLQGIHRIIAIAPDGQVLWKQTFKGSLDMRSAAISPGGTVFFYNFAIPPSGDVLYTLAGSFPSFVLLMTGIGETVIGGASGGLLSCKDTEKLLWITTFDVTADSTGLAIRTEHGEIIAQGENKSPSYSGAFAVADAATGEFIGHHQTVHYPLLAASVLTDEGLIVGPGGIGFGKPLVAYQFPYGGLAKTGWPKMYSDNQNSNRVRGPKSPQ